MSMLGRMLIGQYVPGDSWIHRLDPRTKMIVVFVFIIFIFLASTFSTYLVAAAFVAVGILLSKVSFRYIFTGLKPVWLILLLTFLFHIWVNSEGAIWLEWGRVRIYEGGLAQGAAISVRIALLVLMTSLLTLTTKPLILTAGLEKIMHPLKRVGFPVHEFAIMISIALRFIPTLWQETDRLIKAQGARGASFRRGSIVKRALSLVPIIVPLFVSSFRRADDLALAMEARGYQGGEGRTQLRQLCLKSSDYVALVSTVLFIIILLAVRG